MNPRPVIAQLVSLGLAVALAPLALPVVAGFDLSSGDGGGSDGDGPASHAGGVDPHLHHMTIGVESEQSGVDAYLEARAAEERAVAEYLAAVEAERIAAEERAAHEAQVRRYVQRRTTGGPSPDDEAAWDALAHCETGGNWQMRGSRYSGGLGFYNGTWNGYGGLEYASNAGLASREQQIAVGRNVQARHGWSAWGCARTLGWVR